MQHLHSPHLHQQAQHSLKEATVNLVDFTKVLSLRHVTETKIPDFISAIGFYIVFHFNPFILLGVS